MRLANSILPDTIQTRLSEKSFDLVRKLVNFSDGERVLARRLKELRTTKPDSTSTTLSKRSQDLKLVEYTNVILMNLVNNAFSRPIQSCG